jgi:hypothetical protein
MKNDRPVAHAPMVALDPSKLMGWNHLARVTAEAADQPASALGRLLSKAGIGEVPGAGLVGGEPQPAPQLGRLFSKIGGTEVPM